MVRFVFTCFYLIYGKISPRLIGICCIITSVYGRFQPFACFSNLFVLISWQFQYSGFHRQQISVNRHFASHDCDPKNSPKHLRSNTPKATPRLNFLSVVASVTRKFTLTNLLLIFFVNLYTQHFLRCNSALACWQKLQH